MIRRALLLLMCLAGLANAADPEVRVQARLVPDKPVMTGATVNLEVDLLVDTWFTDAPVLPALQLAGAVVSPPSGQAQHLNQQLDGKAFFGLRYHYQITPTVAQRFDIPALAFGVQPGPDNKVLTVRSQPLSFEASGPASTAGEQRLVAQRVELTQTIERSHSPLRVGDSITRRLHTVAVGAQAMLIPPPPLSEVEGFKRYVQTPQVAPLSDGRGGTLGGQREDSASYVATAAGHFSLPAIELKWWDGTTGEAHTASLPAVQVQAQAGTYQAPFSSRKTCRPSARGRRSGFPAIGWCCWQRCRCWRHWHGPGVNGGGQAGTGCAVGRPGATRPGSIRQALPCARPGSSAPACRCAWTACTCGFGAAPGDVCCRQVNIPAASIRRAIC